MELMFSCYLDIGSIKSSGPISLPDDAGEGDNDAREREDRAGSDAEAVADERVYHDDHHGGDARGDEDVGLEFLLHLCQP